MLNGIRLNSFAKIDDTLKSKISSSENLEFIYDSFYEFEMQYLFNKETFNWRNQNTIEPINFRNIYETMDIVFIKGTRDLYDSYIVYDKDDFNTYEEQSKLLKEILINKYLSKFDRYNRQSNINRNLFIELDVYVLDNNTLTPALAKLEEFINNNENEYINLLNSLKKDLRQVVLYYGQNTLNQFWILFENPDLYINAIDAYIEIINTIYSYQEKVVQYKQSLVGPNSSVYTSDSSFISTLLQKGVFKNFVHLCFTTQIQSNTINENIYNYNKQVLFTRQIYDKNYLINELNLMKNNVYCILNSLFPNLIDYDLSQDLTLQRVYNHALKYNILSENNEISIGNVNQITFYDNDKTDKLYILYGDENVIITPHYARTLYLKDAEYNLLSDREVDLLENDYYAVITEDNTLSITDLAELQNKIEQTLISYKETIQHMVNMLSSGYNKEIIDTNFYKLLRSIAYLLANYKYDLQEVKNSMYLNDLENNNESVYQKEVKGETIYNNFGAIIDLPKKDRWTYEQYRNVVTAVYNACLKGPTKVNIEEAITTFTQYDSVIYELYKDGNNPIFANLADIDKTYRYAVEIHKALDVYDNADELYKDIVYLLTMVKPAQALFLIYITFSETEIYEVTAQVQDEETFSTIMDIHDNFNYNTDKIFKTTDREKRSYIIGNINPITTSLGYKEFTYNKLDLDSNGKPYTIIVYDEEGNNPVEQIDYSRYTTTTIIQEEQEFRRIGLQRDRTFDDKLVMYMKITQQQFNDLTEEEKDYYNKRGVKLIYELNIDIH